MARLPSDVTVRIADVTEVKYLVTVVREVIESGRLHTCGACEVCRDNPEMRLQCLGCRLEDSVKALIAHHPAPPLPERLPETTTEVLVTERGEVPAR